MEELATVYWEVDLVDNVLDHWDVNHDKVPTSHGYIFGLHHCKEQKTKKKLVNIIVAFVAESLPCYGL